MSLPHILLGLTEDPISGYDLHREFEEVVSFFWSAKLPQIYTALKQLEKDGLTRSWTEPSRKGPVRRVYQRTEKGRQVLAEWLSEGPAVTSERRHFLAQVFFLGQVIDLVDAQAFFDRLHGLMHERRDRLEAAVDPDDPALEDCDDQEFYRMLVFDLGREMYATYTAWAERSRRALAARHRDADG